MNAPVQQKLIFSSAVESLMACSRGKLTPQTVQALAKLNFHFDKKLDPAYPAEDWAQAVKLIAAEFFPGVEPLRAHRDLAHAVLSQFTDTVTGRVIVSVARMLGRDRALNRITHSLRTGANFIECRLTPEVGGERTLWINDVSDVPGFYMGLLDFGGHMAGFESHQLEMISRDGPSATFRLKR